MLSKSITLPWFAALGLFVALASPPGQAQQAAAPAPAQPPAQGGRTGGGPPPPRDTLGAGPWDLGAGRGRMHITAIKGLERPWGIAFLPDGNMLVTERPGRLRVIRNGVVDPTPITPVPTVDARGIGGMFDVVLHPNFAQNRLIYIAYAKPGDGPGSAGPGSATTAIYRARWDGGSTLADGKDIFVADAYHGGPGTDQRIGPPTGSHGGRMVFDGEGRLFLGLGDRNIPPKAQDMASHIGKIVRLTADGGVPPDNPFVGQSGIKPEIWTSGHRNPLGLYISPIDGKLWETEEGPQGGDELNIIVKGRNYGWPVVSLGRNYDGTIVGKGFTAPGYEEPIVFWVPAIAISGLSVYNGDRFPQWKGNIFVGGMRNNTGQHIQRVQFNAKGDPTGREIMLSELKQRIREIKPGPDGNLYALTDEVFGAVLKIEPAQ